MSFLDELQEFEQRFEAMEPELAITLKDQEIDVEGYIVVWNTQISEGGPLHKCGKGGTRIHDQLSMGEVKMLARTMALKNAAAGLPLGGSKAGLKADPKLVGFEQKYRRFVDLSRPYLHENGGIFGGFGFDIGANPIHAKWACDELGSTQSFTGKPLDMGGTDYDREGIAGLGVATAAKVALEEKGLPVSGATFSVQGVGAMGAAVVRYFSDYGGVLKAVSDPRLGGTWVFTGVASEALVYALSIQDFDVIKEGLKKEAEYISDDPQDALYQDASVLFPCAVHDVIARDNVGRIVANFISEGANSPVSDDVYQALADQGVCVIPDFIANPGGVIAAFVELTSVSDHKSDEAKGMTRSKITQNVKDMLLLSDEHNVTPRDAGLYLAYKRIFKD